MTQEVREIRLGEVPRFSAEELIGIFEQDFRNLVTVSIADAHRRLSRPVRRLLRSPDWHLDWQDALMWAEGEMQVSAERMRFLEDARAEGLEGRLRRVRKSLHEARRIAADYRRQEYERSPDYLNLLSARHAALTWLTKSYPEDHRRLLERAEKERGVHQPQWSLPSQDVFDSLRAACEEGWLMVTMTQPVAMLLECGDTRFRNIVADDAREQNERNALLRHPLVVGRWKTALSALSEMTVEPAGASSITALGPLTRDLHTLPYDAARQVINARRFFCAIQQRHLECDRVVRRMMKDITHRKDIAPETQARREAAAHADRQLVAMHPHAYAHIRSALKPYESAPGQLDIARLSANERGQLKTRILKEVEAGLPTQKTAPTSRGADLSGAE